MTTSAAEKATAAPRRLSWQCLFEDCGKNFSTTTRRGIKVTCPHCKRVQDGPAAIRARLAELAELRKAGKAKPHTRSSAAAEDSAAPAQRPRARIVSTAPSPKPAAAPEPVAEPPAPSAPAPAAVADPPSAPPAKRRSAFDRLMGYDR